MHLRYKQVDCACIGISVSVITLKCGVSSYPSGKCVGCFSLLSPLFLSPILFFNVWGFFKKNSFLLVGWALKQSTLFVPLHLLSYSLLYSMSSDINMYSPFFGMTASSIL